MPFNLYNYQNILVIILSTNTFNLYAYCYNDPINYADPEGTFVGMIIGTIVATTAIIIGVGANVYNIYNKENNIKYNNGDLEIKHSFLIQDPILQIVFLMLIMNSEEYKIKVETDRNMLSYFLEWQLHNVASLATLPFVGYGSLLSNGNESMKPLYDIFDRGYNVYFESNDDWFINMILKIKKIFGLD